MGFARSLALLSALAFVAASIMPAASVEPASGSAAAAQFQTLYRFKGYPNEGSLPEGPLVADGRGILYGTTFYGGPNCSGGCGTVFKLAPPSASKPTWTESVLVRFGDQLAHSGLNYGISPRAGLTLRGGELFGTNSAGGNTAALIFGTVFKLSPPKAGQTKWTTSALYRFGINGPAGYTPFGGVIFDGAGAIYGTTTQGGAGGQGTVFKLTRSGATWRVSVLHAFRGPDGAGPHSDLLFGPDGALYGTTFGGGKNNQGTVFRLERPKAGQTAWKFTLLHQFNGGLVFGQPNDGRQPEGRLVIGAGGSVFGTTTFGGSSDQGTVYKLARPVAGQTVWKHTILHQFHGSDGSIVHSGLMKDGTGALYGSATGGGPHGGGLIFKLAQSGQSFQVLRSFTPRNTGGDAPFAVVLARSGGLFGTTGSGGSLAGQCGNGCGTVFKLTP